MSSPPDDWLTTMRPPLTAVALLASLLGGVIACGPSRPSPSPTTHQTTRTLSNGAGFRLDVDQALNVTVTVMFLNAYDAGDLDAAMAALGPDPGLSDCDYARQQTVDLRGRAQVASWLGQRFNDHSRIAWTEIWTDNPDPQSQAVGVTVVRVKSDSLAKLGFPDGVTSPVGIKVIFTEDHRIERFAMAPVGGPATACRPS